MSLPPQLSFLRIGSISAPHTLEVWLDYVCPFSCSLPLRLTFSGTTYAEALLVAKMTKNALDPIIKPALTTGPLKDKVQLLVRLQVQPWWVVIQNVTSHRVSHARPFLAHLQAWLIVVYTRSIYRGR